MWGDGSLSATLFWNISGRERLCWTAFMVGMLELVAIGSRPLRYTTASAGLGCVLRQLELPPMPGTKTVQNGCMRMIKCITIPFLRQTSCMGSAPWGRWFPPLFVWIVRGRRIIPSGGGGQQWVMCFRSPCYRGKTPMAIRINTVNKKDGRL